MRRTRHYINTERFYIHRDMTESLYGIGMEYCSVLMSK